MAENHEMNYYNYGKTLSAEGIMPIFAKGENKQEYVDLGLPSGTLWATCNIGASTPYEPGLYFAWGETSGYTAEQVGTDKNFTFNDYKFGVFSFVSGTIEQAYEKYNLTDDKKTLDAEDDAAIVNCGNDWRLPTKDEFDELFENTTNEWDSERSGWTFTSSNGNSLFLFAAGVAESGNVFGIGGSGRYWSSSLDDMGVSNAFNLYFDYDKGYLVDSRGRYYGCSVRPVRVESI